MIRNHAPSVIRSKSELNSIVTRKAGTDLNTSVKNAPADDIITAPRARTACMVRINGSKNTGNMVMVMS